MIDPLELATLVGRFCDAADGSAQKSQELILQLLKHTPTPFSRAQFTPGHITTTGLVLHPDLDAVLLIHHRRLDRWLLPGGHVEPEDQTIFDSARREVLEETGVALAPGLDAPLAGLDVHGIPPGKGEPFHYHHDLIFSFRAGSASLIIQAPEVREARWFQIPALAREVPELPSSILSGIQRAVKSI